MKLLSCKCFWIQLKFESNLPTSRSMIGIGQATGSSQRHCNYDAVDESLKILGKWMKMNCCHVQRHHVTIHWIHKKSFSTQLSFQPKTKCMWKWVILIILGWNKVNLNWIVAGLPIVLYQGQLWTILPLQELSSPT